MTSIQPPSWYYDLTDTSKASPVSLQGVKSPPGFDNSGASKKSSSNSKAQQVADKIQPQQVKKAWEIALAPAKSLPMNLFVSYMSGNSLQIVPITMTAMMFFITPFKNIWNSNKNFQHLVTKDNASDITMAKIVFILCQLVAVGAGVWKLKSMGLLPNTKSDWLAWEVVTKVEETTI